MHRKLGREDISAEWLAGPDGWAVGFLKEMPVGFWRAVKLLYEEVERTGEWPEEPKAGLVCVLPKEGGQGPTGFRPVVMLSLPTAHGPRPGWAA